MSLLVLDKHVERRLRAQRKARGIDQRDEVWEGVYVMPPLANVVHQALVGGLTAAFYQVVRETGLGEVYPGINVSDRVERWTKNYRAPDVVVILNGSSAENHGTFWTGAIDFVVEVVSPGDRSKRKLPFYSRIGVRELLLIGRKPWRLTLYRHNGSKLESVSTCEPDDGASIVSEVLPFSFQLVAGAERPAVRLVHRADGRNWQA